MSDTSRIITVNANRETKPLGTKVFGIAAIVGPNATFSERIKYYDPNDLDGIEADLTNGTSDPEYKAATIVASQAALLTEIAIIREDVGDANITETLNDANNENGKFYGIAGVTRDSDIQFEIATWALANKKFFAVASPDSDIIDEALAVDVLERAFITFDADLITANDIDMDINTVSIVQVPFNTSHALTMDDIATSITTLANVTGTVDLIYDPTGHSIKIVHASAPVVVTNALVTGGASQANITIEYASIAARLKATANDRTACIYHGSASTEYIDSGFLGKILPLNPGQYTAAFKTISGATIDTLTATQYGNAADKFCNTYEEIGEKNQIVNGFVSSGEFADTIIFQDFLVARISEEAFNAIANSMKVPYTEQGINLIGSAIEVPCKINMASDANPNGGISAHHFDSDGVRDGGYEIILPEFSSISQTDKANRILRNVKVKVWLSGAIHAVIIDLTLTL